MPEREQECREIRALARSIFQRVLGDISIARAFERHVQYDGGVLRVGEDLYPLHDYARVFVVAMGKAARAMLAALRHEVGETITGIIADPGEGEQAPGFRYFRGGHPVPNDESLRAADAMLKSLHALGPRALVIYLLSGGSSAIVEKPCSDEISLDDLIATYRALVLCGAPIAEINAVRKHLSAVKGGRLARAAGVAQQVSIMVSDVPDNALDALASGPTMPDSTTLEDCYDVVARYGLAAEFPPSVRQLFDQHALEETPKPGDPAFAHSRWWPILSNETARRAAAGRVAEAGFAVEVDISCDDWDYARAADYLLGRLRELRRGVSRACLISGGEVTVKVTGDGGGGRNQHFALYCAEKIAGENIAVLSASTDGVDGNSPAAGAVVDGTTVERARALGRDPQTALAAFDSYSFFDALGDVIRTGPTGNNIRDLRILLAW
jgi:hydroxypyruvate reductase